MASVLVKVFAAAVFAAAVALAGTRVSAQTHHVLGGAVGLGPGLDVGSWLSGRVFKVGDKISFNCSGIDETIVELEGPEQFQSCDITNPIRLYTDPITHVELEKEGIRYFASGNMESCRNGLKLPVPVQPSEYGPPSHESPPPPTVGPSPPVQPSPAHGPPEPVRPPPAFGPPPPVQPSEYGPPSHESPPPPTFGPSPPVQPSPAHGPPEPVRPPPAFGPPPPPPPSAATYLNGLSVVLFAGLLVCHVGM